MISPEAEARENEIRGMPESEVEAWMEEEGRATQARVAAARREASPGRLRRAGRWIADKLGKIADTNIGYVALGLSFFLVALWAAAFAIAVLKEVR